MNGIKKTTPPPRIAQSLSKFGRDVDIARKKRRLTIADLCERAGITPPLYSRLVKGEPGTAVGAYAMVLFALGCGTPFDALMDPARDDVGMVLSEEQLPRRVRVNRKVPSLL